MKNVALFLLLSIIIGSLASCQKQINYNTDIASLNDRLFQLQAKNDSLTQAIVGINTNVQLLNSNFTQLNKVVDSIKAQLVLISNQITALRSDLLATNANITQIIGKIEELTSQMNILISKLNDANMAISLNTGLVAYYPFTGNANDSSGNGLNGTIVGALSTTDRFGNTNKAIKFSGAATSDNTIITKDDYILVSNFNTNFSDKISISLWANVDSQNYADFLNRRVDNNIDFAVSSYAGSSGVAPDPNTISWNIGGNRTNKGVTVIPYSTWHNYIYTFDGATMKVYLDGVLESQVNFTGVIGNNSNTLMIGKYVYHGGLTHNFYYKGSLDDIRFYKRVLTDSEISYLGTH